MTLFSFPQYEYISERLSGLPDTEQGQFSIQRFDNQELHAVVKNSVAGRKCAVVGSIAPPEEQLVSFLLLGHTLKKEGAETLTAILPYLAYTRQDKVKKGESLAAAWTGALLKGSGVDRVLTVDLHSARDRELSPLPLVSVSPAELFAPIIAEHGLSDATIVAPDNGAVSRCEAVKSAMGRKKGSTPFFEKRRTNAGIVRGRLVGEIGSRAILIDDILDTGGTLVSACEKLTEVGAHEIYIFVTHGLFTGEYWKRLLSLGVKHIFCTDTIPACRSLASENVTVLPIAPLLRENLSVADVEQSNDTRSKEYKVSS